MTTELKGIVRPPSQKPNSSPNRAGLCDVRDSLKTSGLRPTRQRLALGQLLFGQGGRHVTAELLHEEAIKNNIPVSLATVYNALNQFTEVGLLREIAIDGSKTYYDTNVSDHHHLINEVTNEVIDVPSHEVEIAALPKPPEGMEITRVDIVLRMRPSDSR